MIDINSTERYDINKNDIKQEDIEIIAIMSGHPENELPLIIVKRHWETENSLYMASIITHDFLRELR